MRSTRFGPGFPARLSSRIREYAIDSCSVHFKAFLDGSLVRWIQLQPGDVFRPASVRADRAAREEPSLRFLFLLFPSVAVKLALSPVRASWTCRASARPRPAGADDDDRRTGQGCGQGHRLPSASDARRSWIRSSSSTEEPQYREGGRFLSPVRCTGRRNSGSSEWRGRGRTSPASIHHRNAGRQAPFVPAFPPFPDRPSGRRAWNRSSFAAAG